MEPWIKAPFNLSKGLCQQDHQPMNAHILNNPQARQTCNENKTIDWVKKKVELE
jgi:hypothetical protein